MPQIHVCPLSRIPTTVRACGARSLMTLINEGTDVCRPREIEESRHLFLPMSDIVLAQDGHILPAEQHVKQILDFIRGWNRVEPLVIHCFAGVSRSTAAAFIAACVISKGRPEIDIAREIRSRSLTATPNKLLVEIADRLLDRKGRMVAAVDAIGRGEDCFEAEPFVIDLA